MVASTLFTSSSGLFGKHPIMSLRKQEGVKIWEIHNISVLKGCVLLYESVGKVMIKSDVSLSKSVWLLYGTKEEDFKTALLNVTVLPGLISGCFLLYSTK